MIPSTSPSGGIVGGMWDFKEWSGQGRGYVPMDGSRRSKI